MADVVPRALPTVTRALSLVRSSSLRGMKVKPAAPAIATPLSIHSTVKLPASAPSQTPGSSVTISPIRPSPCNAGGWRNTGWPDRARRWRRRIPSPSETWIIPYQRPTMSVAVVPVARIRAARSGSSDPAGTAASVTWSPPES